MPLERQIIRPPGEADSFLPVLLDILRSAAKGEIVFKPEFMRGL